MQEQISAQVLTIYIGDQDRCKSGLLYPAIVEALKDDGIAGVTVLRGLEGFGINGKLHTARLEVFFQGLPVVVQAVDTPEHIMRALTIAQSMVEEGLITLQDVKAIRLTKSAG
jgi:uncharacterized protein